MVMLAVTTLSACAQHQDMTALASQLATQEPPPVAIAFTAQPPSRATARETRRIARDLDGFAACEAAVALAETDQNIPRGLLISIAKVESGRPDPQDGRARPWPWTIDVDGAAHFYATKAEAVDGVKQALAHGAQSVDVGCMQVNLEYHPTAFRSLPEAFDPATNTTYAAQFLRSLLPAAVPRIAPQVQWMTAVGYYHSTTPDLAEAYRQLVAASGAIAALSGTQGRSAHHDRVALAARLRLALCSTVSV